MPVLFHNPHHINGSQPEGPRYYCHYYQILMLTNRMNLKYVTQYVTSDIKIEQQGYEDIPNL